MFWGSKINQIRATRQKSYEAISLDDIRAGLISKQLTTEGGQSVSRLPKSSYAKLTMCLQAADINALFGFRLECMERLGHQGIFAWNRINSMFNWLPLAALIEDRIVCMHGGISSATGPPMQERHTKFCLDERVVQYK